jgi:hypothetical protein
MRDAGYTIKKLYASKGTLKGLFYNPILIGETSFDAMNAINFGAGLMHFDGHGNPQHWATHPPSDEDTWILGLNTNQMQFLINGRRLPIVAIQACHSSQFDVTPLNIFDIANFGKMEWIFECWSWRLVSVRNGGAIATIGNTGLGWGVTGYSAPNSLGGYLISRFFNAIANEDCTTVGAAHARSISDYVDAKDINGEETDRKTIEVWTLLGDPSLKIGGYNQFP